MGDPSAGGHATTLPFRPCPNRPDAMQMPACSHESPSKDPVKGKSEPLKCRVDRQDPLVCWKRPDVPSLWWAAVHTSPPCTPPKH